MIGQVIVAHTLPILGLLLVNITQPQITPTATLNTPKVSSFTPKQEIVWRVEDNETLSGIAQNYYGKSDYWPVLLSDNPWIKDPDNLISGWKLKLRPLPLILNDDELKKEKVISQAPKLITATQTPFVNPQPTKAKTAPTPSSNYDDVYKEAGTKFGVPWQVLYGLHLTETGLREGNIYNGQETGARPRLSGSVRKGPWNGPSL